jgi:hypothetical protein
LAGVQRLAWLVVCLALIAPATAQAAPVVGVADQDPRMFSNPHFEALDVRVSRLLVSYDAVLKNTFEVAYVDAWMAEAQRAGIQPFVTFNHSRGCYDGHGVVRAKRCRLPSRKRYRDAVSAFRARYPDVAVYAPWNEVNHRSQPTAERPRAAARMYNQMRRLCRGCTIVAADVLDEDDMVRYVKRFRRHVKGKPRLWGLHNYGDTNNYRSRRTRQLLRTVKGRVWLTETGGVVHFLPNRPFDLRRAARATRYMFRLARSDRRIKRLYIYQWQGQPPGTRFDAGITTYEGEPRPAYHVVRRHLAKPGGNPQPPSEPPPPPAPPPSQPPPSEPPPPPPPGEEPNCLLEPLICPLAPLGVG